MVTIFIFILGLSVGSFLNVLIDRLPEGQSIGGRSHCDYCKKTLSWQDLIPVVSWIALGGKCQYCRKKISAYYPVVEFLTGLVYVFAYLFVILSEVEGSNYITGLDVNQIPQSLRFFGMTVTTLGIISSLIVIFFADLKYHIIPDEATIGVILFSLPLVLLSGLMVDHIIGGFILLFIIYSLFFITRGRGMGFGDVKFAFAMGLLLGVGPGFLAMYLAFVIGGIVSLFLILFRRRGLKSKIAFGPFLVIGTVIMLFWQTEIMKYVGRWLGFQ